MKLEKIESSVRIVLDFYAAFNRDDIEAMMAMVSSNCLLEDSSPAPDGTLYTGKENITQFWENSLKQKTNSHLVIEDIFGLGMHSIVRWKHQWNDPVGNETHLRGVTLFQIRNGQILEIFIYTKR